jgi:hypothetical protein
MGGSVLACDDLNKINRPVFQAYLSSLERKGFLRRVQRYKPHKGQDTNGYHLAGCRHPWRYPKATLDFGRPEKVFDSTVFSPFGSSGVPRRDSRRSKLIRRSDHQCGCCVGRAMQSFAPMPAERANPQAAWPHRRVLEDES